MSFEEPLEDDETFDYMVSICGEEWRGKQKIIASLPSTAALLYGIKNNIIPGERISVYLDDEFVDDYRFDEYPKFEILE